MEITRENYQSINPNEKNDDGSYLLTGTQLREWWKLTNERLDREDVQKAREIGADHGKNAASWAYDGNTDLAWYSKMLKGIKDGDPMVMDSLRVPSLSGEFAGEFSEKDLLRELDMSYAHNDIELIDECANAYNDAASTAFWNEIERACRYQLGK